MYQKLWLYVPACSLLLYYYTDVLLFPVALCGLCSVLRNSCFVAVAVSVVSSCPHSVHFFFSHFIGSKTARQKGLQLKISQLDNIGAFTEMLINACCPYE